MTHSFYRLFLSVVLFSLLFIVQAEASKAKPQSGSFDTVVIDPGHGGGDNGGIPGQRVKEKLVDLDVALRLQRLLARSGFGTVLTRNSDVFIPLVGRVAMAGNRRNAIFVSIHFNSAKRGSARGIETYYSKGDSYPLAAYVQQCVSAGEPARNRGVKRAGFCVTRRSALRAVLVECGFLTNPADAALASSPTYREQLALKIANGIQRYRATL